MNPGNERPRRLYRRIGAGMAITTILVGVAMIIATFTQVGPSLRVGIILGGSLIGYGAIRLYLVLKR